MSGCLICLRQAAVSSQFDLIVWIQCFCLCQAVVLLPCLSLFLRSDSLIISVALPTAWPYVPPTHPMENSMNPHQTGEGGEGREGGSYGAWGGEGGRGGRGCAQGCGIC